MRTTRYRAAPERFGRMAALLEPATTNGVSTPVQWAALEALKTSQARLDARREEYRERRNLLVAGLNEVGLPCAVPASAFYAFPEIGRLSRSEGKGGEFKGSKRKGDSRKAAALLLEKAHVATIPGVVFGAQGEGHLGLCYAVPKRVIEAGLEAMRTLLVE